MLDEPAEYGTDAHDYDPIDPKLGHYYLWNELCKHPHVSVFGESEFATWDRARFVRSCSTMWPFLRIRRVWVSAGYKEMARMRNEHKQKVMQALWL